MEAGSSNATHFSSKSVEFLNTAIDVSEILVPAVPGIWRGRLKIDGHKTSFTVSSHISNNPCAKIWKAVEKLPKLQDFLCLERCQRLDTQPSVSVDKHIAVFFFPEKGRGENDFDVLLASLVQNDQVLKGFVGDAELLIFPSLHLPEKHHRFKGKYFLWGVFRVKEVSSSQPSAHDPEVMLDDTSKLPTTAGLPEEGMPLKSSVSRPRRGRPRDVAWEHAIVTNKGLACKYCGFADLYNGITNLKIHLGGRKLGKGIQGCPKVPVQVESEMAEQLNKKDSVFLKRMKSNNQDGDKKVLQSKSERMLLQDTQSSLAQFVNHGSAEETNKQEHQSISGTASFAIQCSDPPLGTFTAPVEVGPERMADMSAFSHAQNTTAEKGLANSPLEENKIRKELIVEKPQAVTAAAAPQYQDTTIASFCDEGQKGIPEGEPIEAGKSYSDLVGGRVKVPPDFVFGGRPFNTVVPQATSPGKGKVGDLEKTQIEARKHQLDLVVERTSEPQACTVAMITQVAADAQLHDLTSSFVRQEATVAPKKDLEKIIAEGSGKGEANQISQSESLSVGASCLDMAAAFNDDADSSEVSPVVDSNTAVGSYVVDSSVAPLLQAIIDKYGDIAHNCCHPSTFTRSLVLEKFCKSVKKFEEIKFSDFCNRDLKSLNLVLEEAEGIGMGVEWLRERHDELKETVFGIKNYTSLRDAWVRSKEAAKSSKDALESKKAELVKLQSEFQSLESQLVPVLEEGEQIESSIHGLTSEFQYVHCSSLVDGLV